MAYRKYDTCFFERYAILALQGLLGHKFDGLVNEDRPDIQSEDRKHLGIEVTRAMDQGRGAAQKMLKDLSGITDVSTKEEYDRILKSGYGYGLQNGRFVGGLELDYWKSALPMKQIIASKVGKVASGFYGEFDEFGLFVFSKDTMTELNVMDTVRYTINLQKENDVRYARLFLSCVDKLYACNLEDGISDEYRISDFDIPQQMRKALYLGALDYNEK